MSDTLSCGYYSLPFGDNYYKPPNPSDQIWFGHNPPTPPGRYTFKLSYRDGTAIGSWDVNVTCQPRREMTAAPLREIAVDRVFPPDPMVLANFEFNGDVEDSSSKGHDAVLLGGEFVPTPWGQGLHVFPNGPTGIDWTQFAGLLVHPYTVEVVLTPENIVGWRKLFGFSDTQDRGWYYKSDGIQAYPNPVIPISTGQVRGGEQHYIAFVSTAPDQMDIYFQGTFLGSTNSAFMAPPSQAIFFRDDNATRRGEQLDAVVEALRISGVARTPEEIAAVHRRLEAR